MPDAYLLCHFPALNPKHLLCVCGSGYALEDVRCLPALAFPALNPKPCYVCVVQGMPWKMSDAYLQVLKDHKNMLLAISGVGDSSARGRAFSYIKEDIRKAGREEAQLAPGVKARDDGTITGEMEIL